MKEIHNLEQRHKRIVGRIKGENISKENKKHKELNISNANKQLLLQFNDYLISEGVGFAKIERYLQDLIKDSARNLVALACR